ncbi:helix-turn-helix domain-containing protein [Burkholderia vietnamiensis]
MTAFKLAQYIGMLRPTVIRRLASMVRAGLVVRDRRGRLRTDPRRAQAGC